MIKSNISRDEVEYYGRIGATGQDLSRILDEFYLYVNKEEQSIGRHLAKDGYWESWVTSWMTKIVKEGMVCVDIGANYGYYTRLMEYLCGKNGLVYSFEANPELNDKIVAAINDFKIEHGAEVKCYPIAVSDKKGIATLSIPSSMIGGSTIVKGSKLPSEIAEELWDKTVEVESDMIDNLIDGHVDLIKIDIEGAEPLAWRGMQNVLKNTDIVIVEVGPYSPSDFIDELYENYEINYINNSGEESMMDRDDFNALEDLVMAVLRKK